MGEKTSGRDGDDAYRFLVQWAFVPEFDVAIDLRKQCVISSHSNVVSGMHLGTTLSHNDVARRYKLAAKTLDTDSTGNLRS